MRERNAGLGMVLGIASGLSLAGASIAAWSREVRVDDVAGVPLETTVATTGVELAPLTLPLGIAAAAVSFGLAVRVPGVRRALGAVLVLLGGLATVFAARGLVAALALDEGLEAGAIVAVIAALGIAVSGLLAIRPAPAAKPALPARYDLDADDEDAEWDLASVEEDDDEP